MYICIYEHVHMGIYTYVYIYIAMLTLVSIMLTIYDEFYACTADAILSDVEEVEAIQQANQLALRNVNPTTWTLRELACGSNTEIN